MKTNRKHTIYSLLAIGLAGLVLLVAAIPAQAEANPQIYYYTPTPDANGRIIYIVQAGETCISVALKNSISLDDLRLLNDLSGTECTIREGQELLLGISEEPTAIPATLEPTSVFPTPTPFAGFTEICIRLYEDVNGNALMDEGEGLIADGAVSVSDPLGQKSWTGTTTSTEDVCFAEIPEGTYNISIAAPANFNSTTETASKIKVTAGDTAIVNFGAQLSGEGQQFQQQEEAANTGSEGKSPILAVVGGLMIVAGGGVALYMVLYGNRRGNLR